MQQERILQNLLSKVMHKKRLATLSHVVDSVYRAKNITLTELGRHLALPIQARSGIRRLDRFLGNEGLQAELGAIYGAIIRHLVPRSSQPLLLVDWSKLPHGHHPVLRASLTHEGRSLTLYEEVHPGSHEENAEVHERFLRRLKGHLPEGCRPVLVTDAGFQNPWFKLVDKLGWYYVGRVRGSGLKRYREKDSTDWLPIKGLYSEGKQEAEYLGVIELAKTNPLTTRLYRVAQRGKGRRALRRDGQPRRGRIHREQSAGAKEPWLLVSSLPPRYRLAKKVVAIYKKRMQIEESFRDMKSQRYGFGLRQVRTKHIERYRIY